MTLHPEIQAVIDRQSQGCVVWHGCYDGGWKGLITDESFAHPAKFSRGLIERIVERGLERGYWDKGMTIGDPFGGVGLGGIVCAYHGLKWIGVELEPRFCAFAQANFDLHRKTWRAMGDPDPVLVQGDSRRFAEIVGQVGGAVTSPPYAQSMESGDRAAHIDFSKTFDGKDHRGKNGIGCQGGRSESYGETPGQIGRLPAGKLDAALTSPPYAGNPQSPAMQQSRERDTSDPRRHGAPGPDYIQPECPGQISRLPVGQLDAAITSPPYQETDVDGRGANGNREHKATLLAQAGYDAKAWLGKRRCTMLDSDGYGSTPGNIGNLAGGSLEGVVTSPPWERNSEGVMRADKFKDPAAFAKEQMHKGHGCSLPAKLRSMSRDEERARYGPSDGQIGNSAGETYWQACKLVYEQMRLALKPGGVAAIVVKAYVKQSQIVDLPGDTLTLLVSLGFEPLERVRAMLVKESVENHLFEGPVVKVKERKSFFRRLAERKGSPRIDWECVLFVRKTK